MEYLRFITALEQGLDELTLCDYPALLGQLERLKALVWTRMMSDIHPPTGGNGEATLLNMQQVAKRVNIPLSCAYELVRQRRLPAVRIGKYIRVDPAELAVWMAQHRE